MELMITVIVIGDWWWFKIWENVFFGNKPNINLQKFCYIYDNDNDDCWQCWWFRILMITDNWWWILATYWLWWLVPDGLLIMTFDNLWRFDVICYFIMVYDYWYWGFKVIDNDLWSITFNIHNFQRLMTDNYWWMMLMKDSDWMAICVGGLHYATNQNFSENTWTEIVVSKSIFPPEFNAVFRFFKLALFFLQSQCLIAACACCSL
jgi:hypothetical protein